jgi:hypothetical protein
MLASWGIRDGVTTTAGILGGGEPSTAALGDEFHHGRASMGVRPPVPVPRDEGGLPMEEYLLFLGVKRGMFRRGSREASSHLQRSPTAQFQKPSKKGRRSCSILWQLLQR